jgi:cyclohexanone monooxygenase
MRGHGLTTIEADTDAQDRWVEHSAEVASGTLYPKANSWYLGANIPGKPRAFGVYLGGFGNYRQRCNLVAQRGYEGFAFKPSTPAASDTRDAVQARATGR